MIVHNFEQGTPEWFAARCGIPTASEMDKIITPTKGELSSSAVKYMARLVAERITGQPIEKQYLGNNPDILRGNVMEPRIRSFYEYETGSTIKQVGFVTSDCKRFGCSPDALVTDADGEFIGGLEIKAPSLETLLLWLDGEELPSEHKVQVHGGLAVTGLPFWDFLAYNAALPDWPLRVRVEPNAFTKKLSAALEEFDERLQKMHTTYMPAEA